MMSEDEMRKEENLEHEVLDRLKTLEPIDFDYNVVDGSYVDAMLKARNIILDLYQQEKEKNEELLKDNNALNRLVYFNKNITFPYEIELTSTNGFISKDKIKEKIMEIQKYGIFIDKDYYFNGEDEYPIAQTEFTKEELEDIVIDKLKELLEEK